MTRRNYRTHKERNAWDDGYRIGRWLDTVSEISDVAVVVVIILAGLVWLSYIIR